MKKLRAAFFALFLLSGSILLGQGILGSNITYRAFDSLTYELTVTIYQECSYKNTPPPDSIAVESGSTVYFKSRIYKISIKDVTGYGQKCSTQSICIGSGAYGVNEIVYKDTISLQGIQACDIRFSWTGTRMLYNNSSQPHYNYSTLNKCITPGNSSPVFSQPIKYLVPVGTDFIYNVGASSQQNSDSFSYKLTCPLQSPSQRATANVPLVCSGTCTGGCGGCPFSSYIGFPNPGLGFPAGCHFDPSTGDFMVRPTKSGEFKHYCIEVAQWQNINGTQKIVGITYFEASTLIITDNNFIPKIAGVSKTACSDQEFCFEIKTDDSDNGDTVRLSINNNELNGATVTTTNGTVKHATAKVCWTPGRQHVRNTPYTYTATATDDHCDINGSATRSFAVYVRESPDTSHFEIESKTLQCNEITVKLKGKPGNNLPGFTWSVQPITAGWVSYSPNGSTFTITYADTGWKKFAAIGKTAAPCIGTIIDSIYIPSYSYKLNASVSNDTAVCKGDSAYLTVAPQNGQAPYEYYWGTTKTQSIFARPSSTRFYTVGVIDSNRCAFLDSVEVLVNELPVISAGPDSTVCPGMPFQLEAREVFTTASPLTYDWTGVGTGKVVSTQITSSQKFFLKATDPNGCMAKPDSAIYSVYPVSLTVSQDTSICFGGSATLKALMAGIAPVNYIWPGTTTTGPTAVVAPLADTKYVVHTQDAAGCELYDTVAVFVNHNTYVTATNDTGVCEGNSILLAVTANNGTAPVFYQWDDGRTSPGTIVSPAQPITKWIKMTDFYGCIAYDSIFVDIYNNPSVSIGSDITVCNNTPATLTASVSGGKSPFVYAWSNSISTPSQTIPFASPQSLYVSVADANGCMGSDTITISLFPATTATLQQVAPVCENAGAITLSAAPANGTWTGNGVSGTMFSPASAGKGSHLLTYSYTDSFGCAGKDSITTIVHHVPAADFTLSRDTGTVPFNISLTNTTSGTTTQWNWTVKDNNGAIIFTSQLQNPSVTFTKAGKYSITLETGNDTCAGTHTKTDIVQAFAPGTWGINGIDNPLFKIYPNPAKTNIYIEGETIHTILLTDINGKSLNVPVEIINGDNFRMDISGLSGGVYLLVIKGTDNRVYVNKIIINP